MKVALVPVATVGCLAALVGLALLARYEGFLRSLYFWYGIFPVYLHYRGIQLLKRDLRLISPELGERLYEDAHVRYSHRVRDLHYALRGYYLKNAQLVSTQPDLVPRVWLEWVERTQDNVPSEFSSPEEAKEYCRRVMMRERGLDFDALFDEWDDKPLGIASIGQVHKARLRSTGEYVAVKMQFENMESRFRADMRTLKAFCQFAMPQHLSAFEEVEKNFDSEFNYLLEALNLAEVRASILPRWGHLVSVPRPYLEYCSRSVLVMEFLHGQRLLDGLRAHFAVIAALLGTTVSALEELRAEQMRNSSFRYRTIDEERDLNRRLHRALKIRSAVSRLNPLRLLRSGSSVQTVPDGSRLLDIPRLLETLCVVHASELFEHGVFNADCHPGNVLILSDGRLGLLDYGQVKRMELKHRIRYAKLIVALARDDREEIVRLHFDELGVVTKRRNETLAYFAAAFYHDRDTADVTGGRELLDFMDQLESTDPMVQLPEPYLLAMRGNMILRGVAKTLGVNIRMSKMWLNEALRLLRSQGIKGY